GVLLVPRICAHDEISAIFLIENGNFSKSEISSISSKDTKGKVLEKANDVPPNAGNFLILMLLILCPAIVVFNMDKLSTSYHELLGGFYLEEMTEEGWG